MSTADDSLSVASKSFLTHPSDSTSSSGNGGSSSCETPPPAVYNAPVVAKREDIAIGRAKFVVAFVLLLALAAMATTMYMLAEEQEQSNFENQFVGYGTEVSLVAKQKAEQLFKALDSFSVTISSQAVAGKSTWPFVSVENWSLKAEKLVDLAGLEDSFVFLAPIVEADDRANWTNYVAEAAPSWYQNSIDNEGLSATPDFLMSRTIPFVHYYDEENNTQPTPVTETKHSVPIWQTYPLATDLLSPTIGLTQTNCDILSDPSTASLFAATNGALSPSIGITSLVSDDETKEHVALSSVMQPIYGGLNASGEDRKLVAVAWLQLNWMVYLQNILVKDANGIIAVLRSSCPSSNVRIPTKEVSTFSYRIDGPSATLLGEFDAHDPKYDHLEISDVFVDLDIGTIQLPEGRCIPRMTLHLFPSKEFEATFHTPNGIIYSGVVVLVFVFTSTVFLLYDYFVRRRQSIVMERIVKQDKIVSNMFPTAIRERLYGQDEKVQRNLSGDGMLDSLDFDGPANLGAGPVADLFPSTTVIFADIAGFTPWSSAREPQQVFTLLENIYGAFDKVAYRHGVFKVETVGDCYVAVVGLPEPTDDHAIVACKFARDCLKKMKEVTAKLEVSLGPDTADLEMRIGIHSGQVTAGVLRGERSRFQLFGDTMNTAARMQTSGERNRTQISEATADLVRRGGFSSMITPRSSKIFVKGKGEMQTYWVRKGKLGSKKSRASIPRSEMSTVDETVEVEDHSDLLDEDDVELGLHLDGLEEMTKKERLVEWNVTVLSSLLEQIIASRGGVVKSIDSLSSIESKIGKGATVLEEFIPIIPLKRLKSDELKNRLLQGTVGISEEATCQLRNYLSNIAEMYPNNAFHNFEHASHVTASVKKLLSRIVQVDPGNGLERKSDNADVKLVDLAGHSYGITSDPLTQFAVVFSAIIHDVDHPGVTNAQLVKENTRSAQIYRKSVAEQNSVEIAWEMLLGEEYTALRACIYQTEEDLRRFRQLVVNSVMATDIVDKELQALRKNRWETAFSDELVEEHDMKGADRKATIVIEHLIQASDVAHTMQHWEIYKTWNEKFFMECYGAYKSGRGVSDPSDDWYKGEIGFFDHYVIPLARKLDSCGVFGVSSHEYLNYAVANRDEWLREGGNLVKEFLAKYDAKQQQS